MLAMAVAVAEHHPLPSVPFISSASTARHEQTLRWHDVVIKNTFFDVEEHDDDLQRGESRRSNSLPRTWKPGNSELSSDASVYSSTTAASRGEGASDVGEDSDLAEIDSTTASPHSAADAAAWQRLSPASAPRPRAGTFSMSARLNPQAAAFMPPSIGTSVRQAAAPRLNAQAAAFQPLQAPSIVEQGPFLPQQVSDAVAAATMALQGSHNVSGVQVLYGNENTVSVEGETMGAFGMNEVLQLAKDALLTFAATSQNTYVLGYEKTPFQDWTSEGSPRQCGFQAVIGIVPAEQEATACWDTYQKGFCPRRAQCRWCHPEDRDLVTVCCTLRSPAGMQGSAW